MLSEFILFATILATISTGCGKKKKNSKSEKKSDSKEKSPSKAKDDVEKKEKEVEIKKDHEQVKKEEVKENKVDKKEEENDKKPKELAENGVKKEDNDDVKKGEEDQKKKESEEKIGIHEKSPLITVDPVTLSFDCATTSQKKITLKNVTSRPIMFKIRSTTTNTYLINPVFGKIEPNGSFEVIVTHRPSAKGEHKLVVVTTEMSGKEIEMAKTFKQTKNTGPEVTVKLFAT